MDQFRLELLEAGFGLLPFGEIADEASEEALIARAHLADRKLHREGRAVLALADDDATDADDAALAGQHVSAEIAVVGLAIGRRHQHLDVPADGLARRVAEQALRREAEGLDEPLFVDDHHGFGDGVEDRLEMGFAGDKFAGAFERLHLASAQALGEPGQSHANAGKEHQVDDLLGL